MRLRCTAASTLIAIWVWSFPNGVHPLAELRFLRLESSERFYRVFFGGLSSLSFDSTGRYQLQMQVDILPSCFDSVGPNDAAEDEVLRQSNRFLIPRKSNWASKILHCSYSTYLSC
jgi:hypothetical protein